MKTALLSIQPQYAEEILNGTKWYEYRRKLWQEPNVEWVYFYETAPVYRIVGGAKPFGYINGEPEAIWADTWKHAGLNKTAFMRYFKGCHMAEAVELAHPTRLSTPLTLADVCLAKAPQSFAYMPDKEEYQS